MNSKKYKVIEYQVYDMLEPGFFRKPVIKKENTDFGIIILTILFITGIGYLIYENIYREKRSSKISV